MSGAHESSPATVRSRTTWWQLTEVWGSVAIVTVWVAVLFVGMYGGDMRFASSDGSTSSVPVVVVVAVCAVLATVAVARRAFPR